MGTIAKAFAEVVAHILLSLVGQLGRRGRKKRPLSGNSNPDNESL